MIWKAPAWKSSRGYKYLCIRPRVTAQGHLGVFVFKDNKVAEPYTLTIREETPSPTRREYFPDTSVENALDSPEISPPRETVKDIERAIAGFKSYKLALETKRGVGSKSQQEETEYKIQELE
ncbi:184_t:CDS:2, partial [Entrophospora sp. SA101]